MQFTTLFHPDGDHKNIVVRLRLDAPFENFLPSLESCPGVPGMGEGWVSSELGLESWYWSRTQISGVFFLMSISTCYKK